MMTTLIPKGCLKDIERLQRRFIWGEEDQQRRVHFLNWNKFLLPKNCGGLALCDLAMMNQEHLMKLSWQLRCGSSKLCVLFCRVSILGKVLVLTLNWWCVTWTLIRRWQAPGCI